MYNTTLRSFGLTIVAVEKKYVLTYSELVFVAIDIQHANCMTPLSSVACPALQYFSISHHKLPD